MLKRLLFALLLIVNITLLVKADPASPAQLDKIDDIAILRLLYTNQSLITSNVNDELPGRRYQVGDVESHRISVLGRVTGKFTNLDNPEMLALIGVDTGSDPKPPFPTGIYALLLRVDKQGGAELIKQVPGLQRKFAPFTSRYFRTAVVADMDFDKYDDLIMTEGDNRNGRESYSIYHWDGKDFTPITDHPALAILDFYTNLDAAAHLGLSEENSAAAGNGKLEEALSRLSAKMQGQQSIDSLRRRLIDTKGVEIENVRILIRSGSSALIRVHYRFVKAGGAQQQFEGDYQVRRFNSEWQLDSERLKVLTPDAAPKKPELGQQSRFENRE